MRKIRINKAEILLICGLLLFAGAAALIMEFAFASGSYAVVYVDGEEYGRYQLSEDAEVEILTEYGKNVLVISDGVADVTYADCPDGTCVRSTDTYRTGEMIVCLPHRLMVRIEGENGDGLLSSGNRRGEKAIPHRGAGRGPGSIGRPLCIHCRRGTLRPLRRGGADGSRRDRKGGYAA